MATIYHDWMVEARILTTGQTIYIQCETKEEQQSFAAGLYKELKLLREIDPVEASTLMVAKTFKDSRHWVLIRRIAANPYTGFLKEPDGQIRRISVMSVSERYRRYSMMIADGMSREEIELAEGITFTKEEILDLWPQMRKDESTVASPRSTGNE